MRIVAALYIDPRGPYPKMPWVDCWDETRDARLYAGPHPVVAHPPCGPWGRLRHLCTKTDATCGPAAVCSVQRWGGVLEHPANSKLFDYMALPKPGDATDAFGGRTHEVCQCDWGHVARKRTWLYVVGVDQAWMMRKIRERAGSGTPTHWVSGGRGRVGKKAKTTPVPPGIKVCSATQRRRTPPAFASFLVEAARRSAVPQDDL